MAIAAYTKTVSIKTTAETTASYTELPANAANLNLAGDILDDTDFTSTGYRSRIRGIKDWSVGGTINFDLSNSAVTKLRNAWLNGTRLDIRYLPNGSAGYAGTVHVESIDLSGDVSGLETGDFSLQADGALTTA